MHKIVNPRDVLSERDILRLRIEYDRRERSEEGVTEDWFINILSRELKDYTLHRLYR